MMISVVIPIYNVEKYLNACIQSVVNQSCLDLEIILVNDGSTDSCGAICNEWANKDTRIKVIHKKNGGLSDARNAGIEAATGEYISFIDSDDIIHRDMISDLYRCFTDDEAIQIAGCGYLEVKDESEIPTKLQTNNSIQMTGKDAVLLMLDAKEQFNVVAWNKLYKKSLFNNIRYPKGYNHEDMYVTPRLLYESEKVAYIPCAYYFHRYNPRSIVHSKYSLKSQDEILGVEAMRNYLTSVDFTEALAYVNRIYLWKLIDHIGKTHYLLDGKSDTKSILSSKYKVAFRESKRKLLCSWIDKAHFVALPKNLVFFEGKWLK